MKLHECIARQSKTLPPDPGRGEHSRTAGAVREGAPKTTREGLPRSPTLVADREQRVRQNPLEREERIASVRNAPQEPRAAVGSQIVQARDHRHAEARGETA